MEIPLDAEILHLASDHRKYSKDTENYVYANMLQLADMLLGSVIQSCLKGIKWQKFSPDIDKKSIIAYPVKEMIDKRKRGKISFIAVIISPSQSPKPALQMENGNLKIL